MELVFKIVIGHGTLQGSDGMLDVNMNRATIGQGGHRINTGFVHAAVDNGVDFAAHIDHVGAIHDIVSVLIFGGPAKNQAGRAAVIDAELARSEEHTSELQSLMRISYAVFCLKKKRTYTYHEQQVKSN